MVPETTGDDFRYFDQLLEALSQLTSETIWPKSKQGEFLTYLMEDVLELSSAIRAATESEQWSVAMVLVRPLQERYDYLLAAALDPSFADEFVEGLKRQMERGLTSRPDGEPLHKIARGVINRFVEKLPRADMLRDPNRELYSIGSAVQHGGLGLSRVAKEQPGVREDMMTMMCGRVELALLTVVAAVHVVGVGDTRAWHRAHTLVVPSQQTE